MNCIHHSTNNMVLGPPKGVENCNTITATMVVEPEQTTIATFWKPTQEELELLMSNGSVCLWVWGSGHPMVALTVEGSK